MKILLFESQVLSGLKNFNLTLDKIINYYERHHLDVYDGIYPEEQQSGNFMFNSKKDFINEVSFICDIFESLPDPIPIYRILAVKNISDVDIEDFGNHWSFDKDIALEFGTHNGSNVIVSAKVNKSDVDWKQTFETMIVHGFQTENEIVIDGIVDETVIFDVKIEKI